MKPSDLYMGVVSFLGVLVPGAAFLCLRRLTPDTWCIAGTGIPPWLVFGGVAYLIGQLLLAMTEWFNSLVPPFDRLLSKIPFLGKNFFSRILHDVKLFRSEAVQNIHVVNSESDEATFHRALSYLRIKNQAAAAAEVDHHMADYKLLRNFVAILIIDSAIRVLTEAHPWRIVAWELSLLIVSFAAYARMYNWAQLLAFQYASLIHPASDRDQAENPKPATNAGR